jgi:DNA-3-methyladenine glycosylase II
VRLATGAPFHLEATVRLLQRLPENRVDRWDGRRWTRVLPAAGDLYLISVENLATTTRPRVDLSFEDARPGRAAVRELVSTVRRVLGLDRDPRPFARVAERLAGARELLRPLAGMRPPTYPTLVEAFANTVAFQQLSLAAGTAIVGRLADRFGPELSIGGERRLAFPDAHVLASASLPALRATGLSRAKALTLRGAARAIDAGDLTREALDRLSTDDLTRALEALPGIGPWSARLLALRGLGRLDAFPLGDVGVARGLAPRLLWAKGPRGHETLAAELGEARGYLYFAALALRLVERGVLEPARRRS